MISFVSYHNPLTSGLLYSNVCSRLSTSVRSYFAESSLSFIKSLSNSYIVFRFPELYRIGRAMNKHRVLISIQIFLLIFLIFACTFSFMPCNLPCLFSTNITIYRLFFSRHLILSYINIENFTYYYWIILFFLMLTVFCI